jgi:thiamine kinase-like enzyme
VPDPVTPAWLTAILRSAGVLRQGSVEAVEQQATDAFNSTTVRLRLRYASDATPDAPTRLILKRNIAEAWGVEAGADEVRFYTLVASFADHPRLTPPCYAAAYDAASGDSYLLLQDLSATHRPPVTRDQQIGLVEGVPTAADIVAVVETLARLHTYWWEHPLLDAGHFPVGYWSRTRERFEQYAQRRNGSWQRVLAQDGAALPTAVRALYEQVLAHLPQYWERHLEPRFLARRHLTLTHGDAYFANFLCPTDPAAGPTYLLDWQSPSFDIGGYDLANLCATFWTREQRHAEHREENILRRYHATLCAHGVSAYAWEDLLTDYRHGLVFWLLIPVQDAADGSRRDYWWPKMQCLIAAFQDWHCDELLTS